MGTSVVRADECSIVPEKHSIQTFSGETRVHIVKKRGYRRVELLGSRSRSKPHHARHDDNHETHESHDIGGVRLESSPEAPYSRA